MEGVSALREGDSGTHEIDLAVGMKLCTANCMAAFEPVDMERRRYLTRKAAKTLPQIVDDALSRVPSYLERVAGAADAIRVGLSESPRPLLAGFGPPASRCSARSRATKKIPKCLATPPLRFRARISSFCHTRGGC